MRIVVDQARLSQKLTAVGAVVPTKTTRSILSNILFTAEGSELRVTATDLDLSMTASLPAKVEEPGRVCIPAKRITDIVRSLPAQEIRITVKSGIVRIQCGKSDFKIAGVVSGYGPADIEAEINAVAKGWIPTNLPNRAAVAKLVNPITYVRKEAPPLIVVQGANDNTAPVKDSQHLVDLLEAAGAEASIHLVPGAAHGFDNSTWLDAEKAMFAWLSARGIGK